METAPKIIRFGLFELDTAAGELRKRGLKIRLADQPLQILLLLLECPGEVVSREAVRQRLWPAETFVDFDAGLNTAIKKLRDALGDPAENPRFVETLPRRGYRFIAPIETPPVSQSDSPPDEAPAFRNCGTYEVSGIAVMDLGRHNGRGRSNRRISVADRGRLARAAVPI